MYGNNSENGRFVDTFIFLVMKKNSFYFKLKDLMSIPIKFESTNVFSLSIDQLSQF